MFSELIEFFCRVKYYIKRKFKGRSKWFDGYSKIFIYNWAKSVKGVRKNYLYFKEATSLKFCS